MKIRISLCMASALALVSCEFGEPYDVIAGSARISRLHEPAPVIAKPVAPIATPAPAPVEEPAPAPAPEPEPEPQPVAAQQQPAAATAPVVVSEPIPEPLPPAEETPAPAEPQPVVAQNQPVVAEAAPQRSEPEPEPKSVVSQQQPKVTPPAPKPEPKPVVSQQQPVVNRPVAAPAPKPAVYVPPTPRTVSHAASQQQPTHYNNSRLPIANPNWATPQNHRKATRDYPLMPGQNRGLKARRTVN